MITTTEFIMLPPYGDRITYEILMNSPHPILTCNDSLTSFYFKWLIHLRTRLLYSNDFLCQAESYLKQPSWHWLILTFISFRIFPTSLFEIPKSSAILKHTAQGSFPAFDFSRIAFSNLSRSIANSLHWQIFTTINLLIFHCSLTIDNWSLAIVRSSLLLKYKSRIRTRRPAPERRPY